VHFFCFFALHTLLLFERNNIHFLNPVQILCLISINIFSYAGGGERYIKRPTEKFVIESFSDVLSEGVCDVKLIWNPLNIGPVKTINLSEEKKSLVCFELTFFCQF